jgi:hypothetical protein
MLLEEHDLWDFIENKVVEPTDPVLLAEHKKKMAKTKQVILDSMKDHLIPHITKRPRVKEMFDALVTLYQSENINWKMLCRNKLRATRMSKTDTIATYLMKITELHDQLAAIGEEVKSEELVPIALNGFSSSWQPFVQGVCAQEKLPTFEKLWEDFIQEETRLESVARYRGGEQNLALINKMKKGSKKGGPKKGQKGKERGFRFL